MHLRRCFLKNSAQSHHPGNRARSPQNFVVLAVSERPDAAHSPFGLNAAPFSGPELSSSASHEDRELSPPAPSSGLRAPPRGAEEHRGPDSAHPVSPTQCQGRQARRTWFPLCPVRVSVATIVGGMLRPLRAVPQTPRRGALRPGGHGASCSGGRGRWPGLSQGPHGQGRRAGNGSLQGAASGRARRGGVAAGATRPCSQDKDRGSTAPLRAPLVAAPGSPAVTATGKATCTHFLLVLKPRWPETTQTCRLRVLEAGSTKSGCQQGWVLSGASWGGSCLPFPASRGDTPGLGTPSTATTASVTTSVSRTPTLPSPLL